ncbi:ORF6C domain-containing protein [Paenibacillus glucanolyticus]|uniref:ORF6C domain-containing protein n=1 Tax=Paenibacillus glucanolyticus TaxID=59843 RepID=UPI0030CC098C
MQIHYLKATVENYRNRMPISKQERKVVRQQGKMKVISLLGEPHTESYKAGYKRIFNDLYSDVKGRFLAGTLDEILEIHFTDAIHFINDWHPKEPLKLPQTCFLCELQPGTIDTGEGIICENCEQILGELFQ